MMVVTDQNMICSLLAKNLVDMIERFESREIVAPVAFRTLLEYKESCSSKFSNEQKKSMDKIMNKYEDELGKPLLDKLITSQPLLKINENEMIYTAYINNKNEIRKFIFESLDSKDKIYYILKNIGK